MMAKIRAKQRRVEIKNNERTGIKSPIQPLCERPTQKDASAECAAAAGTEGDGRWCFIFRVRWRAFRQETLTLNVR